MTPDPGSHKAMTNQHNNPHPQLTVKAQPFNLATLSPTQNHACPGSLPPPLPHHCFHLFTCSTTPSFSAQRYVLYLVCLTVSHGVVACRFTYTFSSTLKMGAIRSSETSVNTTYTRCQIPEDCFLHGSTIICWHPEPFFPYDCSRPLPEKQETHSTLQIQSLDEVRSVFKEMKQDLMPLSHTTKHRWFPRSRNPCR